MAFWKKQKAAESPDSSAPSTPPEKKDGSKDQKKKKLRPERTATFKDYAVRFTFLEHGNSPLTLRNSASLPMPRSGTSLYMPLV